ncbi:hypothetical protein CPAR01_06446 [Colletotrichum paranaense]|uniref:Uncharacterized protein n=1 Tax=Colletotrichum paranaense TaxID=1914294 RepID=A0ABQ9SN20_9PEZI|nr:uncharacterized protein CPAR01_06446 [Colletotrichum paranaense]KAK1540457.1 hypothetical protein CPAR01_06446 [Colletotrichum paranaense]
MLAIFVDEKASVPFSLIPSLSTSIGIHKLLLLLLRRRRHRLFVFSFGPRCQLTAILDDGRPLCLLDAALRPPAAKHSHNSRLAASSSSNHSPRFHGGKTPSARYHPYASAVVATCKFREYESSLLIRSPQTKHASKPHLHHTRSTRPPDLHSQQP